MAKAANAVAELQKLVRTMVQEREEHMAAVAEIDQTFEQLGLEAPEAPARGRKKKVAKRAPGRRRRGSFKVTGEQSIVDFVKGCKNPPNAKQINEHWQKEGRGGKADNTITRLVKNKQLTRIAAKGERGGRYKAK